MYLFFLLSNPLAYFSSFYLSFFLLACKLDISFIILDLFARIASLVIDQLDFSLLQLPHGHNLRPDQIANS